MTKNTETQQKIKEVSNEIIRKGKIHDSLVKRFAEGMPFNDLPETDQKNIIERAIKHSKKLQDEVLEAHTDWENQLKGALLLIREEPVEVIFSGGVSKTVSVIPWSMFVLAMDKLLADARREVIDEIARKLPKLRENGYGMISPDIGYNHAIAEIVVILATLRKEESI